MHLTRKGKAGIISCVSVCLAGALLIAIAKPLPPPLNRLAWISLCAYGLLLLIPVLFPSWADRLRRRQEQALEKEPSEQIGRWVP